MGRMAQPLDYGTPGRMRGRRAPWLTSRLSWPHALVPVAVWLCLGGVVLADASDQGWKTATFVAASTALGPMAGAVCRDFQDCCLDFSLYLLPYCAGALAAALLVQLAVPPRGWLSRSLRWLAWVLGTFAWFAGSVISFGHALS